MFKGTITALVTPFKNGQIDYESVSRLLNHQLERGIQGFVVNGTTGESPTLTKAEKLELLVFVQKQVAGRVPILFGSGSNSTAESIELTKAASEKNVDGLLVVTPYYNKPPQRGLYKHFEAIAAATKKPIVLYNVPGRTGVSLEVETIFQLSKIENIMGIKEATGDLKLAQKILERVPKTFALLSGDDGSCVDFCLLGGHGVISVLSHVIPRELTDLIERARKGDRNAAEIFEPYKKLVNLLFCEANPIPVKAAMKLMNVIASNELRLPLVPLASEYLKALAEELRFAGAIK
jgi:4-hydroxy-tetrahydrodipicolinate synthase